LALLLTTVTAESCTLIPTKYSSAYFKAAVTAAMTQTAYRRQVPLVSLALVLLICGVSVMGARVQSERNSLRSAVLNPDAGATKATNGTVSNSDSSNTTSAGNTTTASNGTSSTSNGTSTSNSSTETASVKNSTSVSATVEKPSNQTKANSTVEVKEAGNASVSSNTTVSNSTSKTSTVNATKEPSTPTVDKGEPKTVSPDDRVCPVASCSVEWGTCLLQIMSCQGFVAVLVVVSLLTPVICDNRSNLHQATR